MKAYIEIGGCDEITQVVIELEKASEMAVLNRLMHATQDAQIYGCYPAINQVRQATDEDKSDADRQLKEAQSRE